MDELIEAMATVLDEELDARVYTLRLCEGPHVTLVDGDLAGGTVDLARDVLDKLHERGWHFSKGAVCPS